MCDHTQNGDLPNSSAKACLSHCCVIKTRDIGQVINKIDGTEYNLEIHVI